MTVIDFIDVSDDEEVVDLSGGEENSKEDHKAFTHGNTAQHRPTLDDVQALFFVRGEGKQEVRKSRNAVEATASSSSMSYQEEMAICHAAQLEIEIVDLSSEEDDVEEVNNGHGEGHTAHWTTALHQHEFAQHKTLCKQEFLPPADGVEEAAQLGNQEFILAGNVRKEATQSEDQEMIAAVDSLQEAIQSENEDLTAAVDRLEEAVQLRKHEFLLAGNVMKEAMQFREKELIAAVDFMEETIRSEHQKSTAKVDCLEEPVQLGIQEFLLSGNVGKEAMQSGNQELIAAVDCMEEAIPSENHELTAKVDCLEEAAQLGNHDCLLSGNVGKEAMLSGNQELTAKVDCLKETIQSEIAAEDGPLDKTALQNRPHSPTAVSFQLAQNATDCITSTPPQALTFQASGADVLRVKARRRKRLFHTDTPRRSLRLKRLYTKEKS